MSCLYEGSIEHHRAAPATTFRHRIAFAYIDLDELPRLAGGRLVRRAPGLLRFRRRDYHGDPHTPLAQAVRATVEAQAGVFPRGPIRVLTGLRSFGHCFNPVSFYYCYDETGNTVEHLLAEVNNTPWGERHAYVMAGAGGTFEKQMHVSPFMGMRQTYRCRASAPGPDLSVDVENIEDGRAVFGATLQLRREPLTPRTLRRHACRYPLASGRTLALIYGHALALKLRGARIHPHPPTEDELR